MILAIFVFAVVRFLRAREGRAMLDDVSGHWVLAFALAGLLVSACTFLAVDSAYAVELASSKSVYAKGKDAYVDLSVTLTGSASDASGASLEIRPRIDRSRTIEALLDLEVADGHFLALVPLDRLAPGAYEAVLVSTRDTWLGGGCRRGPCVGSWNSACCRERVRGGHRRVVETAPFSRASQARRGSGRVIGAATGQRPVSTSRPSTRPMARTLVRVTSGTSSCIRPSIGAAVESASSAEPYTWFEKPASDATSTSCTPCRR